MPFDDRIIIPSKMLSQRIAAAMRRTHCAPRAWLVLTMHCLEQLSKDYGSTWQSWTSGHFWTTMDYMSFKCHSFKSSLVFCEVLCILHGPDEQQNKIKQNNIKQDKNKENAQWRRWRHMKTISCKAPAGSFRCEGKSFALASPRLHVE